MLVFVSSSYYLKLSYAGANTEKSSRPRKKKYLPNFPTQKNTAIANLSPKKPFDHPRHSVMIVKN